MVVNTQFKRIVFVAGALIFVFQPTLSYARGDDHHDRFDRHGHDYHYQDHPQFGMRINLISHDYVPVVVGRARYYYYDGLYYTPAGNEYILMSPPIGAIVPAIPPDYMPIIINGVTYYTDNEIYYVYTGRGYQVVPRPVVRTVSRPILVTHAAQIIPEPENETKVAEGMGLGGVLGALLGGIVGHQMKGHHELGGALIGGVAGATAGGILGAQIPNENVSRPVTAVESSAVTLAPAPLVVQVPQSIAATDQGSADGSYTVNIPNGQGGYTPVIIKKAGNGFVGPQGEYYSEFPKVSQLQAMYLKQH